MSSSHTPTPPPRPTRPLIHWVHWLLISLVFLLPILVFGFAFSLRFAIPLTLLLLGAAYWQAPQRPSLSTCLWAAGITFFPFILEQAELLPHPSNVRIESPRLIFIRLGLHIFVPLLILTCGLIFWGADAPRVARASKNLRRGHVVLAIAFCLAGITLMRFVLGPLYPAVVDENLYLFQSSYILDDIRGLSIDSWLEPFFIIRQSFFREGFLSAQYTPGWPFILALFSKAGATEWAGWCLYGGTLIATAVWARMLSERWETVTWAVLLTGAPLVHFYYTHSYLSSTSGTFAVALIAISALAASRRDGWRSLLLWIAAGMAASALATIRPLTGFIGALLLGTWIVLSGHLRWRSFMGSSVGLCIFGFPLLIYNLISTGHPFRFGYQLSQYGLQLPGFGWRGSTVFGEDGQVFALAWQFTPLDALLNFAKTVGGITQEFWPGGIIFFLLLFTLSRKRLNLREALPWVIGIAALPVSYAFYPFGDALRVSECLPVATVGTAIWIERCQRNEARMTRILVWSTLALGLTTDIGRVMGLRDGHQARAALFQSVKDLQQEAGPLLLLVEDQKKSPDSYRTEKGLELLFWFNAMPQSGVRVGRNLPDLQPQLLERFPDHTPIRILVPAPGLGGVSGVPEIEWIASEETGTQKPAFQAEDGLNQNDSP